MKKISYLLILFIVLFTANAIVKAGYGPLPLDPAYYPNGENDVAYASNVNLMWDLLEGGLDEVDNNIEFTCYYSATGLMHEVDIVLVGNSTKSIAYDYTGLEGPSDQDYTLGGITKCPNVLAISSKRKLYAGDDYNTVVNSASQDQYYTVLSPARMSDLKTTCVYMNPLTQESNTIYLNADGYIIGSFRDSGNGRTYGHPSSNLWSPSSTLSGTIFYPDMYFQKFDGCPTLRICKDQLNEPRTYDSIISFDSKFKVCTSDVKPKNSVGDDVNPPVNYEKAEGCSDSKLNNRTACITDPNYSCVWVDRESAKVLNKETSSETAYCNVDNLQYVQCGGAFDIPVGLPRITSFVINALKIATPIILIFVSVISLIKAITADKEDEMEKAKKILIRRIIIAVIIFFTITITQFVINKVADGDEPKELSQCFDCFINNSCGENKYYKNYIESIEKYKCFYVSDSQPFSAEDQEKHCH